VKTLAGFAAFLINFGVLFIAYGMAHAVADAGPSGWYVVAAGIGSVLLTTGVRLAIHVASAGQK
jgi:hypothetical protein